MRDLGEMFANEPRRHARPPCDFTEAQQAWHIGASAAVDDNGCPRLRIMSGCGVKAHGTTIGTDSHSVCQNETLLDNFQN